MKTKFVLSGGSAGRMNEINDKFFKEILATEKDELKVLLVCFAKPEGEYARMAGEDKENFGRNSCGKAFEFEIAAEEKFAAQAMRADIIYLHGGGTLKLLDALKKYPDLNELFKGKVIAGESAGAYVLSACFYSKTEGGLFKGLGFVPVKTICHYEGVNSEKLADCPAGLEELLLPDYEHKTFYIDLA